MITSATPTNLGWNPFHALKSVVRNPLLQNVAKAEANQYAPGAYAQAQADVNQAKNIYRAGQGPQPGMPGGPGPHGGHGPKGEMGPPGGAPVNMNSHMLVYGLIGAGVLVALLVMKK